MTTKSQSSPTQNPKILFVQPSSPSSKASGKKISYKLRLYPPLTFEQLTGVTPSDYPVSIIDERFQKLTYDTDADLIGISCMTPEAPRAYEIADEFRRRGHTVVLGGWHVSALPKEAAAHADSVVIGEAEVSWPRLIQDYKNHSLQPIYRNDKPVDLTTIPPAKRNIHRNIMFVAAMQATRGCPMGCEFCGASNCIDGHLHRKRRIDQVIDEIRSLREHNLYFYDPSFTINAKYSKELFRKMAGLNKRFVCFANIDLLGRDEEFLSLARKAGCQQFFIGFESVSQDTINALGKFMIMVFQSSVDSFSVLTPIPLRPLIKPLKSTAHWTSISWNLPRLRPTQVHLSLIVWTVKEEF